MTFGELKTDTFRRLQESSTSPVFWTEEDVETALNEGYAELADAAEWYEIERTLDLLASRPYYDLRTVFAEPILSVKAIFNPQTNRWLTPTSPHEEDRRDRRWETVPGEPWRWMRRGWQWVGLLPLVAADSGTVRLRLTSVPPAMVEDSDVPGFVRALHRGLVEYALADLWAQDGETTKALEAWQQYLAYEVALTEYTDGRLKVPMVRGLSG